MTSIKDRFTFTHTSSGDETEQDDQDDQDEDKTVSITVTREVEYTEHTAEAHFVGEDEPVEMTFDAMEETDTAIILKDYTEVDSIARHGGERIWTSRGETVYANSQAFSTIPYANLKHFDTVERETKTLSYEDQKWVYESELCDECGCYPHEQDHEPDCPNAPPRNTDDTEDDT